jgi:hypothetical protein
MFPQPEVSSRALSRAIMKSPGSRPVEPDLVGHTGIGQARLALPLVVVMLLAGAGLWRGTFESSLRLDVAIPLRPGVNPDEKMTAFLDGRDLPKAGRMYAELTGRELVPFQASWSQRLNRCLNGRLERWGLVKPTPLPDSGICYHRDGRFSAIEVKEGLEDLFRSVGLCPVPEGRRYYRLERHSLVSNTGN